jgi:orotate phosphoribosyltransferase
MPVIDVLSAMEETGALKQGHFLYASGRHGEVYLEKFDLLRNPAATVAVCAGFAEYARDLAIDVVIGPTTGGVILAFETARQLGAMAAYAERSSDGASGREIRRGTTFAPGTRVLVVDDILTTGGSVRETLEALRRHPVDIVAIGVMVDRSAGKSTFGEVPLFSLSAREFNSWLPAECPLCAEGVPLVKPGTTAQPGSS